ncbi:hypothetical protein G7043_39750 [Lentzea sp. NEAU-D13]|uniref:AAA ATPase domain-containing protein n=1 Tax=Lentzea alba TaxID=2714351 RepID=A0A7C9RYA8_9PSEU|nr:hypothetical protein [Lentzea alba]NGY65066.1 hypothetical protein [Lentzea alba]
MFSDIGALPADADAVFLAAHTPMTLHHLRGTELADLGAGERQVLEAVCRGIGDLDRNTLIAVTGSSGTGKSHVVRWVHANLNQSDDYHILYIPRVVQTIRELLRRIVDGLPGEGGQQILDRIDAAISNASPAEVTDRLLEEVRHALTWTIGPRPVVDGETADEQEAREERNALLGDRDEQGKRRNGLADLLALAPVNKALLRSGSCLDLVVRSFYEETSRRDEQLEGFQREHLPLGEPGVRKAARDGGGRDLEDLLSVVAREPQPALDLLNEALTQAVRKTLGLWTQDRESLDFLFRTARANLRKNNKELVLLFEDLAQFGLVDGELYDQFTVQPGPDLAPLRAVFAITDGPFNKIPETVKTRITHHFVVDSAALPDRTAFVGRYLNLARLGRPTVEQARRQATHRDATDWVPNACDTRENGQPCRVRDECHAGFGTVDVTGVGTVGLYPYNATALRRAAAPRDTTRAVVDVCISDVLAEADGHLDRHSYPHDRVWDQFDHHVEKSRDALLDSRTGPDSDRLYRALVLWGDETPTLPWPVVDAFALPATNSTTSSPWAEPTVLPDAEALSGRPAERQASPLVPLFQWRVGEPLPEDHATFYRNTLFRLVRSRLDLDLDLFHTANGHGNEILAMLFNMTSFDLGDDEHGRRMGSGGVRFELHRIPADVEVMVGARWLADHGHWLPDQGQWDWPDGYTPERVMLSLEDRLDHWAEHVRQAYRDRVRGRAVARAVLGLRAVALIAAGASPTRVRDLNDVLGPTPGASAPSTPEWAEVAVAARSVLGIDASLYLAQFAAARQGDTGDPQVLDTAALVDVTELAVRAPVGFLRTVVDDMRDLVPVVAKAALDLADAVEAAADQVLDTVDGAVRLLGMKLEGHPPRSVATALLEVGKRAKDGGLLRPANWVEFTNQVDILRTLPEDLPLDWRRPTDAIGSAASDEALAVQHWARSAVAGAHAVQALHHTMTETTDWCRQRGQTMGDVAQLEMDVRQRLDRVETGLRALSVAEAGRG